jgi:hypothetical protein
MPVFWDETLTPADLSIPADAADEFTDAELAQVCGDPDVVAAHERLSKDWREEFPDHMDEEGALLTAQECLIEQVRAAVAKIRTTARTRNTAA